MWIPRFEYKITNGVTDASKAGTIDVRFISTNTKEGTQGYTTENGITKSADGYTIHPAFTNSVDNGGWKSELAGIWVAKYEMSGETSGTASSPGNVLTSETVKAVSKPGVTSWRSINIGNCYTNAMNYDRNKESHLMKNSEWGAVAYLTHSQYGRAREEVTINGSGSYYTGGASGAKATTNPLQSSTGNATGIFDLSGGAYEYVAAFNDTDTNGYEGKYGSSFAGTTNPSTEYATKYSSTSSTPSSTTYKPGDATYEVYVGSNRAWFNDYSYFVGSSDPFFRRGGYCNDGADAGVFCANNSNGDGGSYGSFRVVLAL